MTTTKKESEMPTNAPTLEDLERAEQEAAMRVAEARAAADAVRERARQRRADAEQAHDEQIVQAWPAERTAIEAEIVAAGQRLREAVAADPVWLAYRDVVLAGHRLAARSFEAMSATGRVRGPEAANRMSVLQSPALPTWQELAQLVEGDAVNQGRAETEAREQSREDVGQAAADLEAKGGAA